MLFESFRVISSLFHLQYFGTLQDYKDYYNDIIKLYFHNCYSFSWNATESHIEVRQKTQYSRSMKSCGILHKGSVVKLLHETGKKGSVTRRVDKLGYSSASHTMTKKPEEKERQRNQYTRLQKRQRFISLQVRLIICANYL